MKYKDLSLIIAMTLIMVIGMLNYQYNIGYEEGYYKGNQDATFFLEEEFVEDNIGFVIWTSIDGAHVDTLNNVQWTRYDMDTLWDDTTYLYPPGLPFYAYPVWEIYNPPNLYVPYFSDEHYLD